MTMELRYCRINQVSAARHEPRKRTDFIFPHEAAVANDVGGKYRSKSSFHAERSIACSPETVSVEVYIHFELPAGIINGTGRVRTIA